MDKYKPVHRKSLIIHFAQDIRYEKDNLYPDYIPHGMYLKSQVALFHCS